VVNQQQKQADRIAELETQVEKMKRILLDCEICLGFKHDYMQEQRHVKCEECWTQEVRDMAREAQTEC